MKKSQLRHVIKEILEDDRSAFQRKIGSMADTLWKAKHKEWDKEEEESNLSNNQELNGLVDDLQKGVKTNDWKRAKTASEKIDRLLNDWKLDQMG